MSGRSCIPARLMDTWSHGQTIYDLLGIERQDMDRMKGPIALNPKKSRL